MRNFRNHIQTTPIAPRKTIRKPAVSHNTFGRAGHSSFGGGHRGKPGNNHSGKPGGSHGSHGGRFKIIIKDKLIPRFMLNRGIMLYYKH